LGQAEAEKVTDFELMKDDPVYGWKNGMVAEKLDGEVGVVREGPLVALHF
jgi:hypothetical protein